MQTNDFFVKASLICIKLLVLNRNQGRTPLSSSSGPGDCSQSWRGPARKAGERDEARAGPLHAPQRRSGAGPRRARRHPSRGGRCGPSHSGPSESVIRERPTGSPKTRRTASVLSQAWTSTRASEAESVRLGTKLVRVRVERKAWTRAPERPIRTQTGTKSGK